MPKRDRIASSRLRINYCAVGLAYFLSVAAGRSHQAEAWLESRWILDPWGPAHRVTHPLNVTTSILHNPLDSSHPNPCPLPYAYRACHFTSQLVVCRPMAAPTRIFVCGQTPLSQACATGCRLPRDLAKSRQTFPRQATLHPSSECPSRPSLFIPFFFLLLLPICTFSQRSAL
jgi:hypothetical protein